MAMTLSDEQRKRSIASIRRYFAENIEEIGDLKASLLLDFYLKEIAPCIYNQAIADAQSYLQDKLSDLDATCYEVEFGYWE